MSHRPNPPLYYKYTDDDGNIYQVTLLMDSEGTIVNPLTTEQLYDMLTNTNELLQRVVSLLETIASE